MQVKCWWLHDSLPNCNARIVPGYLLQHLGIIMKLFEATIRRPDGSEFKDRVGANDAQEARQLLQQRHGPRAVPYVPHMIPS